MGKRKCLRQAIVELSDSEDEGPDDCIIVENNEKSQENKSTRKRKNITSISSNHQVVRSPVKKGNKEGEFKGDFAEQCTTSTGVKCQVGLQRNSIGSVSQGRKRKIQETEETKMGILFSSKRDPKKQRKIVENGERKIISEAAKGQAVWQKVNSFSKHLEPVVPKTDQRQKPLGKTRDQRATFEQQPKLEKKVPRESEAKLSFAKRESDIDGRRDACLARLGESEIHCVEWTDIDFVQETNKISRQVAENIIKLFKEDNTVPFIARYRKNMTQGMDADELRSVKNSLDKAKLIKQKAQAIIKEIDVQGKWTAELHAFVNSTKSLNDLEHIQSVFKLTKSTLVEKAKDAGLEIPAEAILKSQRIHSLDHFVKPQTNDFKTQEQVKNGIICILADMIHKDKGTLQEIQTLRSKYSMTIVSTKAKNADKIAMTKKQKEEAAKYEFYHNFSQRECNLKSHQILAINRGESRKYLSVKVTIPAGFEREFKTYCQRQYKYACSASPLHRTLITDAVDYAWNKSIKSSIGRRTRRELNEKAEVASMDVFAQNVKQLLLTPPVRGKVILGVDPGFYHGCKLAAISEQGDMLETDTIYPHDSNNPRAKEDAANILRRMVLTHKCTVLALGNGTACRETEVFLAALIKKRTFEPLNVVYTIVDETGASIYSCSKEASTEFPNLDVNVVSAISIARRLQDPMAELVKIEPKHLGVGMYQHDLPEVELAAKLNEVIMEAVSFVGVDINTASISLLKRVSGLGDSRAKHIIEWRKSTGPFRTRKELLKVPRIGKKTFEQCAGFIRIMPETAISTDHSTKREAFNYLDQTWIHPESYDTAKAFVNAAGCNPDQLGTKPFISAVKQFAAQGFDTLAKKFNSTIETMKIIVDGLSMEKGRDMRAEVHVSMFRKSLTSLRDLEVGKLLTGVVRNNTDFGTFVDVGVGKDGLIPLRQKGGMILSIGQRVETKVLNMEADRFNLTLIRCL